jgi:cytoskeletal protein CcmA (bactofilin family)
MVWKKSDEPSTPRPAEPTPANRPATPPPTSSFSSTAPNAGEAPRRSDRATIGPSIFIKGDLTGDEDLVVEGRVDGKIDLKQNNVTIGTNGRVKADIFGRVVTVEGEVDGNVVAHEQAILRKAGAIRGNITAPRVVLEDGSRFKGSIDMEAKESSRDSGRNNASESKGQGQGNKNPEAAAVQAAG